MAAAKKLTAAELARRTELRVKSAGRRLPLLERLELADLDARAEQSAKAAKARRARKATPDGS